MHEIDIMDIGGFKIGQAEDTKGLTGCTVFLFDKQSPAGVDIRGGGPASRETPLLNPVADAKVSMLLYCQAALPLVWMQREA